MAKDKKKNVSENKSEEKVEEAQFKEIDYSELEEKLKEAENQILLSLADNDNLRNVDLGSIPYSAVTQPCCEFLSHLGTF